uniref:Glutaredoxin domain-containing protein n=1 Tax=Acrobeloides nanus TaxID=290746 RepID=A0A914C4N3_9BILA
MLGSVFFASHDKSDEKYRWRVEYPTEKFDGIQLSRKIVSDYDKTGLNLRLYQYQTCPYCCKVRAFLDYYGFSYEVVEVNPVTRSQLKTITKGYKKVPVVTTSQVKEPLVESSLIISTIATFLIRPKLTLDGCIEFYPIVEGHNKESGKVEPKYPNKFYVMFQDSLTSQEQIQNAREEREWREWVDHHFIHLISPNVYRTWNEALDTFYFFNHIGEWERNFPTWERYLAIYAGAAAMYFISKRLKKRFVYFVKIDYTIYTITILANFFYYFDDFSQSLEELVVHPRLVLMSHSKRFFCPK